MDAAATSILVLLEPTNVNVRQYCLSIFYSNALRCIVGARVLPTMQGCRNFFPGRRGEKEINFSNLLKKNTYCVLYENCNRLLNSLLDRRGSLNNVWLV